MKNRLPPGSSRMTFTRAMDPLLPSLWRAPVTGMATKSATFSAVGPESRADAPPTARTTVTGRTNLRSAFGGGRIMNGTMIPSRGPVAIGLHDLEDVEQFDG